MLARKRRRVVTNDGYVVLSNWVCVDSSAPELVGRRLHIGRDSVLDLSGEQPVAVMRGLLYIDSLPASEVVPSQGEPR